MRAAQNEETSLSPVSQLDFELVCRIWS